jgi:hypothetical protein
MLLALLLLLQSDTADDEEYQKAKGDSLEYLLDRPFKGQGTYDTIGPSRRASPIDAPELAWLARHPDGADCRCRARRPSAPADIRSLAAALDATDIDERERAVDAIAAEGDAAVPALARLMESGDPEHRGRCAEALARIRRVRLAVRSTSLQRISLGLLALVACGESHHSDATRNAMRKVIGRQKEDGSFDPEDPRGEALAALALVETHALTHSEFLRGPARAAAGRGRIDSDSFATFVMGVAALRAQECGFGDALSVLLPVHDACADADDEIAIAGSVLFCRAIGRPVPEDRRRALHALSPVTLSSEALVAVAIAMRYEGESGLAWRSTARHTFAGSLGDGCERGSVGAPDAHSRFVHTALQGWLRGELAQK